MVETQIRLDNLHTSALEKSDYFVYISSEYLLERFKSDKSPITFTKFIAQESKQIMLSVLEFMQDHDYKTELSFNNVFTALRICLDPSMKKLLKDNFGFLKIHAIELL